MTTPAQSSWQRDALWLFLGILLFFCIGLGARPYLTPSEARYIELPRQMLATGDWLTPRIDGVPYFEKPPLFYWMQAMAMRELGMKEFAGRSVTALLAAGICLITYACARLLYGRLSGVLAACVLATCMLGYGLSRVAMLDMPVSLFLTACFAYFLAAQQAPSLTLPPAGRGDTEAPSPVLHGGGLGRGYWYYGMYVAAALAVMTKGLIGMVIPGLVIGVWMLLTRRWKILAEAQLFTGLIIFLAIAMPWHVLMARAHPDFLNFYFINEHFTRYLTDSHKRVQPWWFFIAITPAGLLPWTGLLPAAMQDIRKELGCRLRGNDNALFLLLWIVLPLIFFSASHSKLAPYIFPIFPPLAMILGRYLGECWQGLRPLKALRYNTAFVLALFSAAIGGYFFFPLPLDEDNKLAFAALPNSLFIPLALALAGLAYALMRHHSARVLITALALFGATVDITANYAVAAIDHATVKPLAALLLPRLHDGDSVVALDSYFQDLPVYLNRNVTVAGYTGELDFGVAHYPETHGWMISADQFWQRCAAAAQPVYVFMKTTTHNGMIIPANCRLRIVAEYGKTMLLERE